eukprot:TRINITY_DN37774_c0_g1_i1.p1 TRINITY_DN37774_c0_g1~~TRINITY_DN37774_c0_g1_i1.p1  ORF type:complete len:965 (-),score=262.41 TRINITY_DN37774_c0_g1_i1:122-3016(-)
MASRQGSKEAVARMGSKESVTMSLRLASKDPLRLRMGSKESVAHSGSAPNSSRPSLTMSASDTRLGSKGQPLYNASALQRRPSKDNVPVGAAYSVARSRSKTQLRAAMSTQDETARLRRLQNALNPFKSDPSALGQDGLDAVRCLRDTEKKVENTNTIDTEDWSKLIVFQSMLQPLASKSFDFEDLGKPKETGKVALFQKGRRSLLAGLRDGTLERVVEEMEEQKRLIQAELKGLENMELSIPDFIKAFRKNERLIKKVAVTTGIEQDSLTKLDDESLKKWFVDMDADQNGMLSFDEFVDGIVKIREAQVADVAQDAKRALFKKGQRTLLAGLKDGSLQRVVDEMEEQKRLIAAELEAFEKWDLKTEDFIKEFRSNEKLLQKVSLSTNVSVSDLKSLDDDKLSKWFVEMDTDKSGTLSFDEFVEGILKIREEQAAMEAQGAKIALFQKGRRTLLAGLKDGSLARVVDEMEEQKRLMAAEFEAFEKWDLKIPDFIKEFRSNVKLMQKVAVSTGMSVDEMTNLKDDDLHKWFTEMDTDQNGMLSFDEFVEGIVKIRDDLKKGEKVALFMKGRRSLLAGLRDGSLKKVVDEMEAQKAAIAAELTDFENMNHSIQDFIKLFRANDKLIQKVSEQTEFPEADLKALNDADLEKWFVDMDADQDGNLTFDEFVEGIMKVREMQMVSAAKSAKLAVFQKGRRILLAGLKDNSLERVVSEMEEQKRLVAEELQGFESMELSIPQFIKVFRTNEKLVQKVSVVTGVAISSLKDIKDAKLEKWFVEMDTDQNGKLSFDEFIEGIVKVREEQLASESRDAKLAIFRKGQKSLLAGLKDGTLAKVVEEMEEQKKAIAAKMEAFEKWDLSPEEFMKEFRTNEMLLKKLAETTELSVDVMKKLDDDQLKKWFVEMDTDMSGTLSFEEFVEGIMKVREQQQKGEKLALFQKGRRSLLAGLRDGSLAKLVDEMEDNEAEK